MKYFLTIFFFAIFCDAWSRSPAVEDLAIMDLEQIQRESSRVTESRNNFIIGGIEEAENIGFVSLMVAFLLFILPSGLSYFVSTHKSVKKIEELDVESLNNVVYLNRETNSHNDDDLPKAG